MQLEEHKLTSLGVVEILVFALPHSVGHAGNYRRQFILYVAWQTTDDNGINYEGISHN